MPEATWAAISIWSDIRSVVPLFSVIRTFQVITRRRNKGDHNFASQEIKLRLFNCVKSPFSVKGSQDDTAV